MEESYNKRKELINEIKALDFAIIDLGLYLDTHPEDQRAIQMHNDDCRKEKSLEDDYQKLYGPLTIFDSNDSGWKWISKPWPWERGNY